MALVLQFLIGRTNKRLLPGKGTLSIKMRSALVSAFGTPPIKSALLQWSETMVWLRPPRRQSKDIRFRPGRQSRLRLAIGACRTFRRAKPVAAASERTRPSVRIGPITNEIVKVLCRLRADTQLHLVIKFDVCSHKTHAFGSMNRSRGFDSLTEIQKAFHRLVRENKANETVTAFASPSGHRGCYNLTLLEQEFG